MNISSAKDSDMSTRSACRKDTGSAPGRGKTKRVRENVVCGRTAPVPQGEHRIHNIVGFGSLRPVYLHNMSIFRVAILSGISVSLLYAAPAVAITIPTIMTGCHPITAQEIARSEEH